jgi:hypothetical protein
MKELREKVAQKIGAILMCTDLQTVEVNWLKAYDEEKAEFYEYADAIDALYIAHYAEMATKEGLELDDNEIWDVCQKVINTNKHRSLPDGSMQILEINAIIDAELLKVMPWHIAKVAEAVKDAKVELLNGFINDLNQAVVLHNEVKPSGAVMIKAGALHDMTVKYVKQRQSIKEAK